MSSRVSVQSIADGLINWVNSLDVADIVRSAEDLRDGTTIWEVLKHIDRQQFPGALPEDVDSGDWRTRWTNLKHIYKTLTTFLVEDCHQKLPLACGSPDLKEIAQSTSIADMNRLLELVFVAAITCNNCNSYLMGVQELPPSTLEILVPIAQQAGPSQDSESSQGEHEEHEEQGRGLDQEEHRKEKDTNKTKESESTKYGSIRRPGGQRIGSDSELAFEQSVGQVIADKNAVLEQKSELQRQLDDMYDRHTKLQQSHDIVQDQLKEVNDRLKTVLAGKNQPSTPAIQLKHEAKIATLEDKLASTEEQLEHAMRANEVLRIKNEKTQRLQDEYDELKIETSKLSRRANAADKYKQKLEASLNLEKENQDLREQIKDFGKHLKDSDSNRLLSSDLKRENEEYRRVLPGIEQERHELNEMKKRIEFDYLTLEARWQASEEQNTRQKAAIEELQSRLKDYEEGHSPSTPPTGGNRKDLSDYDEQLVQDESREFTTVDVGDQNYISEAELRLIMSAMQAQGRDAASSGNFSGIEVEKKLAEKIERNRDTFKQLIEYSRKQAALIITLQSQVSSTTAPGQGLSSSPPPLPAPSAALSTSGSSSTAPDELNEALRSNQNLRRELQLMASAWYDQNIKLMNSNASMTRGRTLPEPKSFLGKQRKAVENVMMGKSVP